MEHQQQQQQIPQQFMMRQEQGLQPVFYSQPMAEAQQQDNQRLLSQSAAMYPSLQAAPVVAPMVAPQITVPQTGCPFQRTGCRFSKCCKNPEKVLKGLMISQIVFGAFGIFMGSIISSIARIVIASFGLKFLQRRNTGKLHFYSGVSAMNALFTLTILLQKVFMYFAFAHRMHGPVVVLGFFGFVFHIASIIVEIIAVVVAFKAIRKIKVDRKSSGQIESQLEPIVAQPSIMQEIQQEQQQASIQIPILSQPVAPQAPVVISQQQPQNIDHQLLIKFRNEIRLLGDMGFTDVRATVPLLEKHQGNIQNVVQELISKH